MASATTAAAGIGASPIPFADAYVLVPIQISMLARITVTFGLPVDTAFFATLVSATLAGTGATLMGRSVLGAMKVLQLRVLALEAVDEFKLGFRLSLAPNLVAVCGALFLASPVSVSILLTNLGMFADYLRSGAILQCHFF